MPPRRIGLALIAALAIAPATAPAADDPLNILLITSDDLGPVLSCYGHEVISTPNLDRLASEGTRFEVAYVTQASCSPSRSSMFTGLFPHSTGQYGLTNGGFALHEDLRNRTLPNLLKDAGYRTGIIGKLHVAPESSFRFDERPKVDARRVRDVAEAAGKFLESGEGRFFLMVNYTDPHAARTNRKANDWHFPAQVDGLPKDPLKPGETPPLPFQGIDDPAELERVANYYNCAKRLDDGIGMLLSALDRSGHADDTLLIFVGDHGPPFARGKTTCYEGGLRVPFIVRWPGVSRPMVSRAMVSTVDIVPTALDAAGRPIPEGLHGRSLRPVVTDPEAPWREYLAGEFHFHGASPFYPRRAIRDGRYQLIHNLRAGEASPSTGIDGDQAYRLSQRPRYEGTAVRRAFDTFADPPEFELYDLEADPSEFDNLSDNPQLTEVRQRLEKALLAWRKETHDPFLEPAFLRQFARKAKPAPAR